MSDKMQPGRFTLRFNMNDPQQQAAAEILNRMGRQKAQFIAQALLRYTECKSHPQAAAQAVLDEHTLEQAILAVLAHHPEFAPAKQCDKTTEVQNTPQIELAEEPSPIQNDFITEEGLSAINKTLSAFWEQ